MPHAGHNVANHTFLTSNFFLLSVSVAADLPALTATFDLAGAVSAAASCISTSAMLCSILGLITCEGDGWNRSQL